MDYTELLSLARQACANAYAPYSKIKVGAAILTSEGIVFSGCNVENASFGGTVCAERCAAVKAVSAGQRSFVAVAVASTMPSITPCGICRQFLSEFSPSMDVITEDINGAPEVRKLSDYLPFSFALGFLS